MKLCYLSSIIQITEHVTSWLMQKNPPWPRLMSVTCPRTRTRTRVHTESYSRTEEHTKTNPTNKDVLERAQWELFKPPNRPGWREAMKQIGTKWCTEKTKNMLPNSRSAMRSVRLPRISCASLHGGLVQCWGYIFIFLIVMTCCCCCCRGCKTFFIC